MFIGVPIFLHLKLINVWKVRGTSAQTKIKRKLVVWLLPSTHRIKICISFDLWFSWFECTFFCMTLYVSVVHEKQSAGRGIKSFCVFIPGGLKLSQKSLTVEKLLYSWLWRVMWCLQFVSQTDSLFLCFVCVCVCFFFSLFLCIMAHEQTLMSVNKCLSLVHISASTPPAASSVCVHQDSTY